MPAVFLRRPAPDSLNRLRPLQRFFLVWTPALIGVAVIAVESQPLFSAANTSFWLRPLWERLFGATSTPVWGTLHHILRKTGHFTGYGMLCVLFLRAWLLSFSRNPSLRTTAWRWKSWFFAVGSTFLVASADEFHQSFLPSRTGLFSDVVLDTCGGIAFSGTLLAAAWLVRRMRSRNRA